MSTIDYDAEADRIIDTPYPSIDRPIQEVHPWIMTGNEQARRAALKVLRHLRSEHSHSIRVCQELVLAILEVEGVPEARDELTRMEKEFPEADEETLCRFGRVHRILGERAGGNGDLPTARRYFETAWTYYDRAFALRAGHYPGINRASLYLLRAGVCPDASPRQVLLAQARTAARELLALRDSWPADFADDTIWHTGTAAEANLLLGEYETACKLYRQALDLAGDRTFYRGAMRDQYRRLRPLLVAHCEATTVHLEPIDQLFA